MLKTCKKCKRLFSGSGEFCSKCKMIGFSSSGNTKLQFCKQCNIATKETVGGYCFNCAIKYVDQFKIIRSYLNLYPQTSIAKLSKETKISTQVISNYIKEGRIEILESKTSIISKDSNNSNHCIKCGKSITFGTLCSFCKKQETVIKQSKQDYVELHSKFKKTTNNRFHIK